MKQIIIIIAVMLFGCNSDCTEDVQFVREGLRKRHKKEVKQLESKIKSLRNRLKECEGV